MNLQKLFAMQLELDTRIEKIHQLSQEELVAKKLLALLVELGELANETRCFKFWSLKAPSTKERILDEYADGLHFILSVGIIYKWENVMKLVELDAESDQTNQFIEVYKAILTFEQNPTIEAFNQVFSQYLCLGKLLGFSEADIENAYIVKNQVNHERQNAGY